MYDVGDYVKALVIAIDVEKQRLKLSLKASHFEGDEEEDSSDEEGDEDEDDVEDFNAGDSVKEGAAPADSDSDDELMQWARQKKSSEAKDADDIADESSSEDDEPAPTKGSSSKTANVPPSVGVGK